MRVEEGADPAVGVHAADRGHRISVEARLQALLDDLKRHSHKSREEVGHPRAQRDPPLQPNDARELPLEELVHAEVHGDGWHRAHDRGAEARVEREGPAPGYQVRGRGEEGDRARFRVLLHRLDRVEGLQHRLAHGGRHARGEHVLEPLGRVRRESLRGLRLLCRLRTLLLRRGPHRTGWPGLARLPVRAPRTVPPKHFHRASYVDGAAGAGGQEHERCE
mmetsp:Transcript_759/g.1797  ORF Transcript_759/g.1797 Transcript_759/m.1797 type:complete len:220 (-) Transcript_759:272-931(-)